MYAPGVLAAAQAQAQAAGGKLVTEQIPSGSRRPSFRVPPPDEPAKDNSPSPEGTPSLIVVEDDRRTRRRGSQL